MTTAHLLALALAASAPNATPSKAAAAQPAAPAAPAAADPLNGLKYRLVGPFRGGRATGVAGVVGDPTTFYFGAAAGGLWKTVDGGVTWKPLWDNFPEASQAVGSVAVAPSDPNIVYAGTGETNIRGDVVTGNGLYKSTDAGKTWKFAGLRDSQVIGRIIIDPKDPNRLFVAALGHIFGDNDERGVFRSTDGGATWKKVLFVDAKTGASDVRFDPSNPQVLYAGMWQVHRKPWIMESGGPGSGLYKSLDGGETWTRLSGGGLPDGIWGRVNVAPSADPKRVYAMIEAKKGGLYRSDDGGKAWTLVSDKNDYRQRAWYFNTVFADPKKADTLYVLNTNLYRSTNAGKTFKVLKVRHGDTHELWIDPTDTRRMINGNDGGANISVDNGDTWTSEQNQPTAQFYHVATDDQFPFRLYGSQQDAGTVSIASAGGGRGEGQDWYEVAGGESGYVVPDPRNAQIVYAGGYDAALSRYDHRTDMAREITPWPRNIMGWAPKDLKYRFQWTFPIMMSRHEPHALYAGGQMLFRSTDEGQSWSIVSPDLTRDDKTKQLASGGPLTKDNTSIETYDTLFSIAESPLDKNQIWVGSDDGLVHLTRDGTASWADVTPKAMPEWATVDMIEADARHAGVAYVAADRHRIDDFKPYAFRTADFGKTWTAISDGLPADAYVHVVRADPAREGLLYAGTERGVFVSYDDGGHWRPLQLNLPVAPVHDLMIHGDSLAVATHGRAFWVLDDLSAVRQWSDDVTKAKIRLFAPKPANHTVFGRDGATISYYLSPAIGKPRPAVEDDKDKDKDKDGDKAKDDKETARDKGEAKDKDEAKKKDAPDPFDARIKLEILDAEGRVVRTIPDPKAAKAEPEDENEDEEVRGPPKPKLTHFAGLNTFAWDQRYEGATSIAHSPLWAGSVAGPKALPGRYQVRLTLDGKSQTQPLEILPDPRNTATPEALKAQFELHAAINAELTAVHDAVLEIRAARARLAAHKTPATEALDEKMTAVEEVLIQPRAHASEDALNYPVRLNNMLAALAALVDEGDSAPTTQNVAMFAELKGEADQQLAIWRDLKAKDLAALEHRTRK